MKLKTIPHDNTYGSPKKDIKIHIWGLVTFHSFHNPIQFIRTISVRWTKTYTLGLTIMSVFVLIIAIIGANVIPL